MTKTSGHYKDVPNGVTIFMFFIDIKQNTHQIHKPTNKNEYKNIVGHCIHNWLDQEQYHTAKKDIKAYRKSLKTPHKKKLHHDTTNQNQPQNRKKYGAEWIFDILVDNWRIGATYQKINGHMIHGTKLSLELTIFDIVI